MLFSLSRHRSVTGIPAPFPLIQEPAHAGAGTRARKNFFRNISLRSSPIPQPLLLWARGAHNRWQREPSPRLALKLSTQAYQSHSPHTSGPVAAAQAQGGLSPLTPPNLAPRGAGMRAAATFSPPAPSAFHRPSPSLRFPTTEL